MGKQCARARKREGEKYVSETYYSFLFFLTLSFICLCLCLEYLSHCCLCNHIIYAIRQYQLDSCDMYYLCLCANSNLRSSYNFLLISFFSAVTFRYMPLQSCILLLLCIILVSLLHTSIKWMNESFSFPWCIYFRNLPLIDTHIEIEIEVCCCLLYLISFEHFKTTNSFFLLNTIINVAVWQIPFFSFKLVKKRKGNHNPIEGKKGKRTVKYREKERTIKRQKRQRNKERESIGT